MIIRMPRFCYLVLTLLLTTNSYAQDVLAEAEELQQFLSLLEEQTSLATQTRMNADFVPGMVSVLNKDELESRGFRTVWEALATLPGVTPSMSSTGMRSVSVRGIGNAFEPAKIKLLLNGKALNISASTTTGAIYDMPVQQVERIEFIRGPGSAIHGEFAYAGVLNVITRKNIEAYSSGVALHDGFFLAGLKPFEFLDGGVELNINIAAQQSNGETLDSGPDRSPDSIQSYAPGSVNNKRDLASAILDLTVDNLSAGIQFQQVNRGDYFGVNNLLPPDKKQTVISDSVLSIYVRQTLDLGSSLSAQWSLHSLQNVLERNGLFLGSAEAFGGLPADNDIIADSLIEEHRIEAGFNLQYAGEWHDLFAELIVADIRVTESEQFINLDPVTFLPTSGVNEFPGPVDESLDRRSLSLVLQDQFHIDRQTTLTTGIRYDRYEDTGDSISPRIALVWRESNRHIYKGQIARAFRPPSLIEEGGATQRSIDAEIIDTVEIGHIYNHQDLTIRNTLYRSNLIDLITFQETSPIGFSNSSRREVMGYELEVENTFAMDWHLTSSLAVQEGDSDDPGSVVPLAFKLGLEYDYSSRSTLSLQLSSISARDRTAGDARSDFPQSNRADFSVRLSKVAGISGLSLRFGIDNLFDEDLRFIASENSYADDYLFSNERFVWLQLSYRP